MPTPPSTEADSPAPPSPGPATAKRARIRAFRESDVDGVAEFEAEIARRSFADEAVTDLAHYRKKLGKLLKYGGDDWMRVLIVDAPGGERLAGWAWVSPRQNFITGDLYADFRSLYVDGGAAGPAAAVGLLRAVLAHCEEKGFSRIVGRTASSNDAMRALYRLAGFEERHVVYELDVTPKDFGAGEGAEPSRRRPTG